MLKTKLGNIEMRCKRNFSAAGEDGTQMTRIYTEYYIKNRTIH